MAESSQTLAHRENRWLHQPWWQRAAALIAGLLLTLAFAPHNLWLFGLLSPAFLIWRWSRAATAKEGAWLGFAFGLGSFASGTWWLYISIHVFGQAPVWIAFFVMGALVMIMSAYYAGLGWFVLRFLPARSPLGWLLGIPAAWLFVEWWRGWFLSGFPWLSLGYSQTDTWLAGFAPVGGVYLISALLLVGAGALLTMLRGAGWPRGLALALLVLPWIAGWLLRDVEWTQPAESQSTVAIVQGAVPQDMKWLVSNSGKILADYARLHREALGAQLIIWPESALPEIANLLPEFIGDIWSTSERADSAVMIGIMRLADEGNEIYHNSVLGLGEGEPRFYDKTHLVPFGEYFPVPDWVRSWLRLMSLPYSDFTPGAADQRPMLLGGLRAAASICYEDAYPGSLRSAIRESDVLVNVTNDAWFGRSGARYQHLQISRMRAAESRRFLLRAANDGVSGIIGPDGKLRQTAPEFEPAVLRATIVARSGDTPYLMTGNAPIISLVILILATMMFADRKLPGMHSVYRKPRNPEE